METLTSPDTNTVPSPLTKDAAYWLGTPELDKQIIREIYRSLVLLNADIWILGIVNSWKSTIPARTTLAHLQRWNQKTAQRLQDRILSFENVAHADYIPAEDAKIAVRQFEMK